MIPQMNKIVKIMKVREERNNSNENYSNNHSVRKIYYKGNVDCAFKRSELIFPFL